MNIQMAGPVAVMGGSRSAVYFSMASANAGTYYIKGTASPVKKMQTALDVAYWGEDNRFPQNIEQQMAYCGIGKAVLNRKLKALWGGGIRPGKVIDYEDGGKTEVFQPLKRSANKEVYAFLEQRTFFRFWLEFLQDWNWYANCFPEMILSKDGKTITGFVHQESCDARYKQMNDEGKIDTVYLSKLWGAAADQFAKFDPDKKIKGLLENPKTVGEIDNKFVKALDCIDMYNPIESLRAIAEMQVASRGLSGYKSAILPVNYPSVNKTYYQVATWDGARLAGWIEIASKIPSLIKTLYNKAFRLKYHIEVPETYFERTYGYEKWHGMSEAEQKAARLKLLKDMDDYLTSDENAYKSFISFFDVDPISRKEYGQVKINHLEDKTSIDKELITSSSANVEIMMAMETHPSQFSAGGTGSMYRNGGGSGSDIREAGLDSQSKLNLERNVFLEPLYLVRDYNNWDPEIVFKIEDTVLTTLDKGKGTEKIVS